MLCLEPPSTRRDHVRACWARRVPLPPGSLQAAFVRLGPGRSCGPCFGALGPTRVRDRVWAPPGAKEGGIARDIQTQSPGSCGRPPNPAKWHSLSLAEIIQPGTSGTARWSWQLVLPAPGLGPAHPTGTGGWGRMPLRISSPWVCSPPAFWL